MQAALAQGERMTDIAAAVVATMHQLGILGLPRNYEVFYEALTGTNTELQLAVVSLGKHPTQEELDQISQRFFAQSHGHRIVEQARDVVARELEDIATLLRSEHSHIEKYGRILDETSSGLSNRNLVSGDLLQKIVTAISAATTSTIDHGKQVASTLSEKTAELDSVKTKLEEYKRLADTDPLTQIWNRRAFDVEIARIYNSTKGILFNALILADIDRFPMVSTAVPEARHQRFFETWTQTLADSAFDQQHYTFASNSLAACLDYVEHTDAVINHTDVMAREFERRGLHRLSLTDPARKRTVGIYVLRERMGEQRTMETITLLKQAAATVLPL